MIVPIFRVQFLLSLCVWQCVEWAFAWLEHQCVMDFFGVCPFKRTVQEIGLQRAAKWVLKPCLGKNSTLILPEDKGISYKGKVV